MFRMFAVTALEGPEFKRRVGGERPERSGKRRSASPFRLRKIPRGVYDRRETGPEDRLLIVHMLQLWPESRHPKDVRDLLAAVTQVEKEGVGASRRIIGDRSTPVRGTHSTG